MVKATNNIDRILASNKNLVQTELNKINQQKVLYLQSGDKANNSGMLPQDILDFSFQKVEKDNFIPDNLTYSKPTNAGLPLLTILQASFERGEDIKLVPTTLNLLEQVLSDPNSETLAKETAVFIINSAVKNGQNIPEALKSQAQNVVLLSPQLLPQNNVNHKLISIIAEGFKDNQVAVKEFSEPILNQLRVILNNPSAEPKTKQDAIFIITEAIKHVGQVGSENLTVPKDLVELAGASKSIQNQENAVNKYKNLESLARKFENNINVKLTPNTIKLLTDALQDPAAPLQAKQDAATIIIEAFGNEGQNLVTEELVELAQNFKI